MKTNVGRGLAGRATTADKTRIARKWKRAFKQPLERLFNGITNDDTEVEIMRTELTSSEYEVIERHIEHACRQLKTELRDDPVAAHLTPQQQESLVEFHRSALEEDGIWLETKVWAVGVTWYGLMALVDTASLPNATAPLNLQLVLRRGQDQWHVVAPGIHNIDSLFCWTDCWRLTIWPEPPWFKITSEMQVSRTEILLFMKYHQSVSARQTRCLPAG